MGFRSGLLASHYRTENVCHCPAGGRRTSGGNAALWHWSLDCASEFLVNSRFNGIVHTFKWSSARSSKAALKQLWTSTMFVCRASFIMISSRWQRIVQTLLYPISAHKWVSDVVPYNPSYCNCLRAKQGHSGQMWCKMWNVWKTWSQSLNERFTLKIIFSCFKCLH